MMFKQIRDILTHLQEAHNEIIAFFKALEERSHKNYVSQLLNQLQKRHEKLKSIIGQYQKERNSAIMDAWIQFSPERSVKEELKDFNYKDDLTIDDVTGIAVYLDNWLEDLIHHLVVKSNSREAREIFSNLLEMMKREKLDLSSNSALMKDI